jgi:hypothetical protein
MKIKVQVVIESDGGDTKAVENIACLERGILQPAELGLTLDEAKDLLESMQHTVIEQQVAEYLEQQAHCPGCGKKRRSKGHHNPIVYRTLFGKLRLPSARFFHCRCQPHTNRTFSPLAQLLTERTAPELLYLETEFAALASYGMTVKLLQEVLPLGNTINAATVRNKVHAVGRRIDQELGEEQAFFIDGCEYDWEQLPRPDLPLTVGIDGGYVHSNSQISRKEGWFEVIAGKSVTADGASKCFAFVNNYDSKPKRRLFEVLKSQGMQPNQQVTFLSDGADNVRDLQLYMNPNAEHILDWFHITKRVTVMRQMAKGLGVKGSELRERAIKELERIKWFLWHGNTFRALQTVSWLHMDIDADEPTEKHKKLLQNLEEFETYIRNNAKLIVNYGERWRYGEAISTAFVESTINQVVSKRMVKKQQMRWSQQGAHWLLQVRTRVLNDELREIFQQWYPRFVEQEPPLKKAA